MKKLAARFNGIRTVRPAIETEVSSAGSKWKMMVALRHSPRMVATVARMFRL